MAKLTDKQRIFVNEYLVHINVTKTLIENYNYEGGFNMMGDRPDLW